MKNKTSNFYRFFICTLLFTFFSFIITSCKKDAFITSQNAQLTTSLDSLKYDTVFTSIGSITQSFKINNVNNQKLLLSSVKLMSGNLSSFRININGNATTEASNIIIEAGDSIYVFVTVKINPNTANLPFIVKDSILIMYNGNRKFVQLQAYGQNANFLRNYTIKGNVTWVNNLPYVILGSLKVDTSAALSINAGCKIFSHADAPFIVNGTLLINGTQQQPVIFNGDRLDEGYKDLAASWPGIYFTGSSKNNVLTYASIKNAVQAVVAEQPSNNNSPKLVLHKCIIDNASDAGILSINSSITAENCLITNCGFNVNLSYGGIYTFINCTVVGYSNNYVAHKNPDLIVSDFTTGTTATLIADLSATFTNCIFWGDNGLINNEVAVTKQGANNNFNVLFDHCLYKITDAPVNSTSNQCIKNKNPLFDKVDVSKLVYNLHINNPLSPCINNGVDGTGYTTDLDNNKRTVGVIDIGCYEKQ